ncbi:hypothetical protein AgCh_029935 [Apium graveolens]
MLGHFASTTEAKVVNKFCRTSDYKRICNTIVRGAKNWHEATRNAIESSIQVATVVHISDCQDVFEEFGASLSPIISKIAADLSKQVSNSLAVSEQT